MAAVHYVELIEVGSDLSESVIATVVWDGTRLDVEAEDDEDRDEFLAVARDGVAGEDGVSVLKGADGLAFLQALQRAYAGSRFYAGAVKQR